MKKGCLIIIMLVLCLGIVSCSNNQSDSENCIIKLSHDKILVPDKGTVEEKGPSNTSVISSVEFKVLNTSKKPIDFDGLVLVAYDANGNMVKVTDDNKPVTIKPNKKSKTLKYSLDDYARLVVITGYKYSENNNVYMDNLDGTEILKSEDKW